MRKSESYAALVIAAAALFFGEWLLGSQELYVRLLIGIGLGYALSRGYIGFAGSVNRAYTTGSTRLMRILMFMFFISALMSVAVLYGHDATSFDLWVNPINTGLLIGGLLFGFGMVFSGCCASGVLVNMVELLPQAIITLFFFGMGVFIGFPVQQTASWINESWLSTPTGTALGTKGVYFPDLFPNDGLNGYLGAILLTAVLCFLVIGVSYLYENKRKKSSTYRLQFLEHMQVDYMQRDLTKDIDITHVPQLFTRDTFERLFVNPWSMRTGAMVIASIFVILMGITKAGWGASTPYGIWFGKLLITLGVGTEHIVAFTGMKATPFINPFFSHPITVQNIGIILGALLYMLCCGQFINSMKASLHISGKQIAFFALGGFCMGIGTRFANGCNVGALFTPIANFSLSGWIFFIFLVAGAIIGNKVAEKARL